MSFVRLSVLASVAAIAVSAAGCRVSGYYNNPYYYDCWYDYWGYYTCGYVYYNADGSVESSRDVVTDVATAQEQHVARVAEHFAEKFGLSEEQSLKLARTTEDFAVIENRSEQDLADFARRLYGVDPSEIVAAVGSAQAGNAAKLNSLVEEAAANFGTTTATMKEIVKTLHGNALAEQGISL
jgi:hypothetical protein